MKTKLEEIKKRHAAELARHEEEMNLRQALPQTLREPHWVHVSPLYGTAGLIKWEQPFGYNAQGGPDVAFLKEAAEALPPVRMSLVRDTFLKFVPSAWVEGQPEEAREKWREEYELCPFTVHMDQTPGYQSRYYVRWTTEAAGALWRVEVELPQAEGRKIAYAEPHYEELPSGERRRAGFRIHPGPIRNAVLRGPDGEWAEAQSSVKWAGSSSADAHNPHTFYWAGMYEDQHKVGPAALADALTASPEDEG